MKANEKPNNLYLTLKDCYDYELVRQEIYRDCPRPPFSLVLGKEYFDCPQRDAHAVQHLKEREEGSLDSCTV